MWIKYKIVYKINSLDIFTFNCLKIFPEISDYTTNMPQRWTL